MKKSQIKEESNCFNKRQLKNSNTHIYQNIFQKNLNENTKNNLTDRNNFKNIVTLASSSNNLTKKNFSIDQKNNNNEKENNIIGEYKNKEINYNSAKDTRPSSVNKLKDFKVKFLIKKNNSHLLDKNYILN